MMSEDESSLTSADEFGSSRLLRDIEEIGRALYLHDVPQKALIAPSERKPKYADGDPPRTDKKPSVWKWMPLRALTHIRSPRLNCRFFLHVHSIHGLPPNLNGLSLCVYWKRRYEVMKSRPTRVDEGVAEFEDTLMHRCSVYLSRSGSRGYEPKLSLLYASVVGAPGLDLGKHWVDLTRLLPPPTLMESEELKNHHGKWTTSFKLTGKAKGATINASFGFSLSGSSHNLVKIPNLLKGNGGDRGGVLRSLGSISSDSGRKTLLSMSPYGRSSVTVLYQLLDDAKSSRSRELSLTLGSRTKSSHGTEVHDEDVDFTVSDEGIEFPMTDLGKESGKDSEYSTIETIDVAEMFEGEEAALDEEIGCNGHVGLNKHEMHVEESAIEELESFFESLSISESPDLGYSFRNNGVLDRDFDMNMMRSCGSDDFDESVVTDFMSLLGSESEPEPEPDSPRERLLREFEKEALDSGNFLFNLDDKEENQNGNGSSASVLSSPFHGAETEHDRGAGPSLISRRKAKTLENLETEALMHEWGLNERAFQNTPQTDPGAFGSPVYLSPERPAAVPPLGDGLGPFMETKGGGFLRSMSQPVFKSARNGARLVMQASSSVVLPPAMGHNGMDVLRKWAAVGAGKMVSQADQLMPVEEIAGKTLQTVAWEAEFESEATKETATGEIDSEYDSLANVARLATEKIQYLVIEGLRIQSGMSNKEPTSCIRVPSTRHPCGVPCSGFIGNPDDIDELIGTSLSLEEWTRFDSANLDRVSGIPAALRGETDLSTIDNVGRSSDQNRGYFGNGFTVALRVLLRDPLRDHEPVGAPMLVVVQVERIHAHTFRTVEAYVSGFKPDLGKGQRSAARWLQSSGMTGKTKARPLTGSNALVRSSSQFVNNAKGEDVLWSVSSYFDDAVAVATRLYVRNPDIIFK